MLLELAPSRWLTGRLVQVRGRSRWELESRACKLAREMPRPPGSKIVSAAMLTAPDFVWLTPKFSCERLFYHSAKDSRKRCARAAHNPTTGTRSSAATTVR